MHLSMKPNGKVVKHFGSKKNTKKGRENLKIISQQLSIISDIELTQDDQFERLSWLLSVIASIILAHVTVVIMFQEIIFKLDNNNDQSLTNRKIVQHQAKGKITLLIISSNFRLTELKQLVFFSNYGKVASCNISFHSFENN